LDSPSGTLSEQLNIRDETASGGEFNGLATATTKSVLRRKEKIIIRRNIGKMAETR
jgi:hypothetical protein